MVYAKMERIHYTSDGHTQKAAPEGRPWPEGDAIIAALADTAGQAASQGKRREGCLRNRTSQAHGQGGLDDPDGV